MDHFGRLLKQANNNMMRHFDQFARQYDLTGNQMAVIDFITNHADQEVFQRDIEHEFEIQSSLLPVNLIFEKRKKSLPSNFKLKRGKSFSKSYNTTVIFKFI